MRTQQNRRYVFIDFENLQKVKFRKLEKVCSRIFILIDAEEKSIPFPLVRQIQKLGKAVKWITVENPSQDSLNFHICYLMGTLHQKVSKKIEFAVLSNDHAFDSLVNSINKSGRNCLRVKSRKTTAETLSPKKKEIIKAEGVKGKMSDSYSNSFLVEPSIDNQLLNETANETIQRLIRSGKRPEEVEMLRNYILLHNQELTKHGKVDVVIDQLRQNKKIAIHKGAVTYNF
jgi:transcriptional regulator NrdR family protein